MVTNLERFGDQAYCIKIVLIELETQYTNVSMFYEYFGKMLMFQVSNLSLWSLCLPDIGQFKSNNSVNY